MYLPDGFILKDGLVFWGVSFSRESYVARGYEVRVPNLDIASNHILNEWHTRCRRMLSQLQDIGIQFQWSVGCDTPMTWPARTRRPSDTPTRPIGTSGSTTRARSATTAHTAPCCTAACGASVCAFI